jgi:hypothetical protein
LLIFAGIFTQLRVGGARYQGQPGAGLDALLYNKLRSERLKKAGVLSGEYFKFTILF